VADEGSGEVDKVTCGGHSIMIGFTFVVTEPYITCNSHTGYMSFVFLEKRVKTKSVCLLAITGNDMQF
jgi:hypothetical protein